MIEAARVVAMAILLPSVLAPCAAAQSAGQTPATRLTLEDAIERGLASSHRVQEAAARGRAADSAVAARHAAGLPQVAVQAGYRRINHVDEFGVPLADNQLRIIYPDIPDYYRARLDVQWPLYTAGRQEASERAARADAGASAADVDTARADLRLDITRAYWNFVMARESLHVFEQSLLQVEAHLRDVRNRLDAGLVPPNDVFSVEAQSSRQRMLTIQARAQRDVAEAQLARFVGLPPGTPIDPATLLGMAESAAAEPLSGLIAIAQRRRSDRAALVRRAEAARERATAVAAGSKPVLAAAGGFEYARPNLRIFPLEDRWQESWEAGVWRQRELAAVRRRPDAGRDRRGARSGPRHGRASRGVRHDARRRASAAHERDRIGAGGSAGGR
jgi:outer membrane protein TolC